MYPAEYLSLLVLVIFFFLQVLNSLNSPYSIFTLSRNKVKLREIFSYDDLFMLF